jgi:hypothetical protein
MSQNQSLFSQRGDAFVRIDVAAASPQMRHQNTLEILLPAFTSNTTTSNLTSCVVPVNSKVVAGWACFRTPLGMATGTATIQAIAIGSNGSTLVNISNTVNALAQASDVPFALALATTNPTTLPAGSSVKVNCVTTANAISTAQAGGYMVLVLEPIEDSPIVD